MPILVKLIIFLQHTAKLKIDFLALVAKKIHISNALRGDQLQFVLIKLKKINIVVPRTWLAFFTTASLPHPRKSFQAKFYKTCFCKNVSHFLVYLDTTI